MNNISIWRHWPLDDCRTPHFLQSLAEMLLCSTPLLAERPIAMLDQHGSDTQMIFVAHARQA